MKNKFLTIVINLLFIAALPWVAYHFNLFLPNEIKVKNFIIKINDKYKHNINVLAGDKFTLPLNLDYPYLCFVSSFINYKIDNSKDKNFFITLNDKNNKDILFIKISFNNKNKTLMPTKIINCKKKIIIDTNKLINSKNDKMVFKFKHSNYYHKQYECQDGNTLIEISSSVAKFPIIK